MNKQYYNSIFICFFCALFLTGCTYQTKKENSDQSNQKGEILYPKLFGCVGELAQAYETGDEKRLNGTLKQLCDAQIDKEYGILIGTDGNVELVKNDIQHIIRGIRQTTKSTITGYGFIKDFKLLNDHPSIRYVTDIARPASHSNEYSNLAK